MRADGAVLLRRRPETGLLGGMIELPTTPWRAEPWALAEARAHAPEERQWQALPEPVRHGFTHFEIELTVAAAETDGDGDPGDIWCPPSRFSDYALPTLTRKLVRYASRHRPGPAGYRSDGRRLSAASNMVASPPSRLAHGGVTG